MNDSDKAWFISQVKVSPSGQMSVSIEALSKTKSFKQDLATLKRIRILHTKHQHK